MYLVSLWITHSIRMDLLLELLSVYSTALLLLSIVYKIMLGLLLRDRNAVFSRNHSTQR